MITRVTGVASDASAGSREKEIAPSSLPEASKKPSTTMAARPVPDVMNAIACVWDLDLTDQQRWFIMRAAEVYPRSVHHTRFADLGDLQRIELLNTILPWLALAELFSREFA